MKREPGKKNPLLEDAPTAEEFHVPASDMKGHSVQQYFRVQPGHSIQIDNTVRSRKFPYRNKGDFLRHAIMRHLKWLAGMDSVNSVTTQVDAIIEVLRDDEFQAEFNDLFIRLGDRIAYHLGSGDGGMVEARRILEVVEGHLDSMPDGYWKGKHIEELRVRFGHLLVEEGSGEEGEKVQRQNWILESMLGELKEEEEGG
jgi:hypothetical protein